MGFKMNCDRCGRFIQNISMKELKKQTVFDEEIICAHCKKWEQNSQQRVEKAIGRMKNELESYKKTFIEEIRDICNASRGGDE